jgi:hypothetical protein
MSGVAGSRRDIWHCMQARNQSRCGRSIKPDRRRRSLKPLLLHRPLNLLGLWRHLPSPRPLKSLSLHVPFAPFTLSQCRCWWCCALFYFYATSDLDDFQHPMGTPFEIADRLLVCQLSLGGRITGGLRPACRALNVEHLYPLTLTSLGET